MDPDSAPVLSIAVSAANKSVRDVTEFADKVLRRRLESIAGVGQVLVLGGRERQVNIWLDADRLRAERIGYFFDVMTNGFGEMSSYAAQVPPDDRWAIAAYIRALQLSRGAPAALLSPADLARLDQAPAPPDRAVPPEEK